MTTSNHFSPLLASVAEYRAAGCRWSVIAWRMEMPLEKLRETVRAAGKAFRRRVRWLIRDRRREEEMKEFARLRRELREALTETEARIAAEKLSALGLRLMRRDFQERRERLKRRARRLREEAKQNQEAPASVVAPVAVVTVPPVRERRPRRAAVMRARYRRRNCAVAILQPCSLASRKAISPVRVARPPPSVQIPRPSDIGARSAHAARPIPCQFPKGAYRTLRETAIITSSNSNPDAFPFPRTPLRIRWTSRGADRGGLPALRITEMSFGSI